MSEAPAERTSPDWERIEIEYRAGILSTREIASKHQISHTAINKRAKRDGWTRDLAAKIQAKAEALVSKRAVSIEVSKEALETERVIVQANAEAIATVRLGHRKDISRARALCLMLLAELEAVTGEGTLTIELLQDILDSAQNPDGNEAMDKILQKARDALGKAMSLPSRAGSLKALADSLKTLVLLERQAWGLAEDSVPDPESAVGESFTADQSEAAYARMRG